MKNEKKKSIHDDMDFYLDEKNNPVFIPSNTSGKDLIRGFLIMLVIFVFTVVFLITMK